jgi:hypothetical protein
MLSLPEGSRRALREAAGGPEAWFPALVFTLPGYDCFPIGPARQDPTVLAAAVEAAVGWFRAQGGRLVAFLYVGRRESALAEALTGLGFEPFPLSWRADLHLPGSSFSDYLAALPARRRSEVLRERRVLERTGISVRCPPLSECLEDVLRLRGLHRRKYGQPFDEGSERARLQAYAEGRAAEARVFGAWREERLLAFTLFAWDGQEGVWHAMLTGSDSSQPAARQAYFETTFYSPVEAAYGLGRTWLSYGHGPAEAKVARGCDLEPVSGFVLALAKELEEPVRQCARRLRARDPGA